MEGKDRRRSSEILLREDKPSTITLDFEKYHEMLERLEDVEALNMLE